MNCNLKCETQKKQKALLASCKIVGTTQLFYKETSLSLLLERRQLEVFQKLGHSTREIGAVLNRHHSCIARELKRNHNINDE